jgi:hypothetical protein
MVSGNEVRSWSFDNAFRRTNLQGRWPIPINSRARRSAASQSLLAADPFRKLRRLSAVVGMGQPPGNAEKEKSLKIQSSIIHGTATAARGD